MVKISEGEKKKKGKGKSGALSLTTEAVPADVLLAGWVSVVHIVTLRAVAKIAIYTENGGTVLVVVITSLQSGLSWQRMSPAVV